MLKRMTTPLALLAFTGMLAIAPPFAHAAGTTPALQAFGKGVQVYTCTATGNDYAWHLKAPEATLSDAQGKVIGKHFAGPSWRANDGSTVVGEPLNASPSPNQGAIPWLVLHAKSHDGSGDMANVAYIVRTQTEGGVAPATGCDAGHANTELRVPYTAVYLFFRG
ncbi:MAG TPA: DUF3455 domain-containing protein [Luteibacter sp.]|jgi:hypothetical protein|nr:DUF3455 domain-containing protein [Luteibacter sp.]